MSRSAERRKRQENRSWRRSSNGDSESLREKIDSLGKKTRAQVEGSSRRGFADMAELSGQLFAEVEGSFGPIDAHPQVKAAVGKMTEVMSAAAQLAPLSVKEVDARKAWVPQEMEENTAIAERDREDELLHQDRMQSIERSSERAGDHTNRELRRFLAKRHGAARANELTEMLASLGITGLAQGGAAAKLAIDGSLQDLLKVAEGAFGKNKKDEGQPGLNGEGDEQRKPHGGGKDDDDAEGEASQEEDLAADADDAMNDAMDGAMEERGEQGAGAASEMEDGLGIGDVRMNLGRGSMSFGPSGFSVQGGPGSMRLGPDGISGSLHTPFGSVSAGPGGVSADLAIGGAQLQLSPGGAQLGVQTPAGSFSAGSQGFSMSTPAGSVQAGPDGVSGEVAGLGEFRAAVQPFGEGAQLDGGFRAAVQPFAGATAEASGGFHAAVQPFGADAAPAGGSLHAAVQPLALGTGVHAAVQPPAEDGLRTAAQPQGATPDAKPAAQPEGTTLRDVAGAAGAVGAAVEALAGEGAGKSDVPAGEDPALRIAVDPQLADADTASVGAARDRDGAPAGDKKLAEPAADKAADKDKPGADKAADKDKDPTAAAAPKQGGFSAAVMPHGSGAGGGNAGAQEGGKSAKPSGGFATAVEPAPTARLASSQQPDATADNAPPTVARAAVERTAAEHRALSKDDRAPTSESSAPPAAGERTATITTPQRAAPKAPAQLPVVPLSPVARTAGPVTQPDMQITGRGDTPPMPAAQPLTEPAPTAPTAPAPAVSTGGADLPSRAQPAAKQPAPLPRPAQRPQPAAPATAAAARATKDIAVRKPGELNLPTGQAPDLAPASAGQPREGEQRIAVPVGQKAALPDRAPEAVPEVPVASGQTAAPEVPTGTPTAPQIKAPPPPSSDGMPDPSKVDTSVSLSNDREHASAQLEAEMRTQKKIPIQANAQRTREVAPLGPQRERQVPTIEVPARTQLTASTAQKTTAVDTSGSTGVATAARDGTQRQQQQKAGADALRAEIAQRPAPGVIAATAPAITAAAPMQQSQALVAAAAAAATQKPPPNLAVSPAIAQVAAGAAFGAMDTSAIAGLDAPRPMPKVDLQAAQATGAQLEGQHAQNRAAFSAVRDIKPIPLQVQRRPIADDEIDREAPQPQGGQGPQTGQGGPQAGQQGPQAPGAQPAPTAQGPRPRSRAAAIADIEDQILAGTEAQAPAQLSAAGATLASEYEAQADNAFRQNQATLNTAQQQAQAQEAQITATPPPTNAAQVQQQAQAAWDAGQQQAQAASAQMTAQVAASQAAAAAGVAAAQAVQQGAVATARSAQTAENAAAQSAFQSDHQAAQAGFTQQDQAAQQAQAAQQQQAQATAQTRQTAAQADSQAKQQAAAAQHQADNAAAQAGHQQQVASTNQASAAEQQRIQADGDQQVARKEADGQRQTAELNNRGNQQVNQITRDGEQRYQARMDQGNREAEARRQQGEAEAAAKRQEAESQKGDGGLLGKALDWVKARFNELMELASQILEAARAAVNAILEAARSAAMAILDAARNAALAALNAVKEAIQGVISAVASAIRGIISAVANLVRAAIQALATALQTLVRALTTLLTTLVEVFQRAVNAILDGLIAVVSLINEDLGRQLQQATQKYRDAFNNACNQLQTKIQQAGQALEQGIQRAADRAIAAVDAAEATLNAAVTAVETTLNNAVEAAYQAAATVVNAAFDAAKATVNAVFDAAVAATNLYFDTMQKGLDGVKTFVNKAIDVAKEAVKQIGAFISQVASAITDMLPSSVLKFVSDVWNSGWRNAVIIGLATIVAVAVTVGTGGVGGPVAAVLLASLIGGTLAGGATLAGDALARQATVTMAERGEGIYVPGAGMLKVGPDGQPDLSGIPESEREQVMKNMQWALSNFDQSTLTAGADGRVTGTAKSHEEIGQMSMDEGAIAFAEGAVSAGLAAVGGLGGTAIANRVVGKVVVDSTIKQVVRHTVVSAIVEMPVNVISSGSTQAVRSGLETIRDGGSWADARKAATDSFTAGITDPATWGSSILAVPGAAAGARVTRSAMSPLLRQASETAIEGGVELVGGGSAAATAEYFKAMANGASHEEALTAAQNKFAESFTLENILVTGGLTVGGKVIEGGVERVSGGGGDGGADLPTIPRAGSDNNADGGAATRPADRDNADTDGGNDSGNDSGNDNGGGTTTRPVANRPSNNNSGNNDRPATARPDRDSNNNDSGNNDRPAAERPAATRPDRDPVAERPAAERPTRPVERPPADLPTVDLVTARPDVPVARPDAPAARPDADTARPADRPIAPGSRDPMADGSARPDRPVDADNPLDTPPTDVGSIRGSDVYPQNTRPNGNPIFLNERAANNGMRSLETSGRTYGPGGTIRDLTVTSTPAPSGNFNVPAASLTLEVPAQAGRPAVDVQVDVSFTPTLSPTSAHGADAGPARFTLTQDSSGNWRATVEVDPRVRPEDLQFIVGHELAEIGTLVNDNPGGVPANGFGDQMSSGVLHDGSPENATPTAHDRAAAQEVAALANELDRLNNAGASPANRQHRSDVLEAAFEAAGLNSPGNIDAKVRLLREAGAPQSLIDRVQRGEAQRVIDAAGLGPNTLLSPTAVQHLLFPEDPGSNFHNGMSGGHETSRLLAMAGPDSPFAFQEVASTTVGGTTVRQFAQFRWNGNGPKPMPGSGMAPGEPGFNPADWAQAAVPKTTADDMGSYLREVDSALDSWLAANGNTIPTDRRFTQVSPSGILIEGYFEPNLGPDGRPQVRTAYMDAGWLSAQAAAPTPAPAPTPNPAQQGQQQNPTQQQNQQQGQQQQQDPNQRQDGDDTDGDTGEGPIGGSPVGPTNGPTPRPSSGGGTAARTPTNGSTTNTPRDNTNGSTTSRTPSRDNGLAPATDTANPTMLPEHAVPRNERAREPNPVEVGGKTYDIMGVTPDGQLQLRPEGVITRNMPVENLTGRTVDFGGQPYQIASITPAGSGPTGGVTVRLTSVADPSQTITVSPTQTRDINLRFPGDHSMSLGDMSHGVVRLQPTNAVETTTIPLPEGQTFEVRLRGRELDGVFSVEVRDGQMVATGQNREGVTETFPISSNDVAPRYLDVQSANFADPHQRSAFEVAEDRLKRTAMTTADTGMPIRDPLLGALESQPNSQVLDGIDSLGVQGNFIRDRAAPPGSNPTGAGRSMTVFNIVFNNSGQAQSVLDAMVDFRRQNPDAEIRLVVANTQSRPANDQTIADERRMQQTMADNNIELVLYAGGLSPESPQGPDRRVIHAKGVIVDSDVLFTTAGVIDPAVKNKTDIATELPPEAAAAFKRYFDEAVLGDASIETRQQLAAELAARGVLVNDPVAELPYIARANDALIGGAQEDLFISTSELRDPEITAKLIERARTGVQVKLLARDIDPQSRAMLEAAAAELPNLRFGQPDTWDPRPHYNVIIADGMQAYVGTAYLWPNQQSNLQHARSFENGVILQGDQVGALRQGLEDHETRATGQDPDAMMSPTYQQEFVTDYADRGPVADPSLGPVDPFLNAVGGSPQQLPGNRSPDNTRVDQPQPQADAGGGNNRIPPRRPPRDGADSGDDYANGPRDRGDQDPMSADRTTDAQRDSSADRTTDRDQTRGQELAPPRREPTVPDGPLANQDAMIEQLAHGMVGRELTDADVAFLEQNGYRAEPILRGSRGFVMRVFTPTRPGQSPIVSFRGTVPTEVQTLIADADPRGIGMYQFDANLALIHGAMSRAAEHGPVIVAGHSLGGALSQIAASRFPDMVRSVRTYQAPGSTRDVAERIRDYNEANPERAIDSVHHRVEGDLVTLGGTTLTPGTIHHYTMEGGGFGANNALARHLASPLSQRERDVNGHQLPTQSDNPDVTFRYDGETSTDADSRPGGPVELVRKILGTGIFGTGTVAVGLAKLVNGVGQLMVRLGQLSTRGLHSLIDQVNFLRRRSGQPELDGGTPRDQLPPGARGDDTDLMPGDRAEGQRDVSGDRTTDLENAGNTRRDPSVPTGPLQHRDAMVEQLAHGMVSRELSEADLAFLAQNGYSAGPIIHGTRGFVMRVFAPTEPGRPAIVSFRGTVPTEVQTLIADVDPSGIGMYQWNDNRDIIEAQLRQAAAHGPIMVSGHSLGGALSQITASQFPDLIGEVVTFQAPSITREAAERIRQYNRDNPDQAIESTHHRVDGDLVPMGGETLSPGTVHHYTMEGGNVLQNNILSRHLASPLSQRERDLNGHQLPTQDANPEIGFRYDGSNSTDIDTRPGGPIETVRKILGAAIFGTGSAVVRLRQLIGRLNFFRSRGGDQALDADTQRELEDGVRQLEREALAEANTEGRDAASGDRTPESRELDAQREPNAPTRPTAPLQNRDAVVEQLAHGMVGRELSEADLAFLEQNGYSAGPILRGRRDFVMRVFTPTQPGQPPIVSFRGTVPSRVQTLIADADPSGIGMYQWNANRDMIEAAMRQASAHGPIMVAGHSLGGALSQITASQFPDLVGEVMTFQAPGVTRETADRIREYNQANPDQAIESTHHRVEGDLVPLGGETLTPGTLHRYSMEGGGFLRNNALSRHLASPLSQRERDLNGHQLPTQDANPEIGFTYDGSIHTDADTRPGGPVEMVRKILGTAIFGAGSAAVRLRQLIGRLNFLRSRGGDQALEAAVAQREAEEGLRQLEGDAQPFVSAMSGDRTLALDSGDTTRDLEQTAEPATQTDAVGNLPARRQPPTPTVPAGPLQNRDAVVEQLAHGMVGRDLTDEDLAFLEQNGYAAGPIVRGRRDFVMRVFLPTREGVPPIVSFRGTVPSRVQTLIADADPSGIGMYQFNANRELIAHWMNLASTHGQIMVAGHSLGGALSQITASQFPDLVGEVMTFQAPGVTRETADRIREYNQANPDQAIESTHHRVEGDLVPLGGETLTPGTLHRYTMEGGNMLQNNALTRHLASPLSQRERDVNGHQLPTQNANPEIGFTYDGEISTDADTRPGGPTEMARKVLGSAIFGTGGVVRRLRQMISRMNPFRRNRGEVEGEQTQQPSPAELAEANSAMERLARAETEAEHILAHLTPELTDLGRQLNPNDPEAAVRDAVVIEVFRYGTLLNTNAAIVAAAAARMERRLLEQQSARRAALGQDAPRDPFIDGLAGRIQPPDDEAQAQQPS